MKAYIYFIINKITHERYVGQTTNLSRRKKEHFSKLNDNRHPNMKLQNAWNKYGEKNFIFEKIQYDNISKDELNNEEIKYIKQYDSYNNGYNLTHGGDGGDTRSKLTFDQFCFAYFGNQQYDGMTNRTGQFLDVDSACIAAIKRGQSYDKFREQALLLPDEEKKQWVKKFEDELNIKTHQPWVKQQTLDDDTSFKILCVVSTYGRGIEATILKNFGLTKGFVFHLMTGKGRIEIKERYRLASQEERINIGRQCFSHWNLQQYSRLKIKEEYKDLFLHYGIADLK